MFYILIGITLIYSCSSNYHDKTKRNIYWSYFQKKPSEIGEWIKVKNIKIHINGIYKTFHINGKISASTSYFNNKKHGVSKLWYNNGNITVTKHFFNGKKTGEYKRYFKNGNLEERIYYKNGLRNGDEIYYYENGQISSFGKTVHGKFEGNWIKYNKNGILIYSDVFKNGNTIFSKKMNFDNSNFDPK